VCPSIIAGYYFYSLPGAGGRKCWQPPGEVPAAEGAGVEAGKELTEGNAGASGQGGAHLVPAGESAESVASTVRSAEPLKPKLLLPRIYKALFTAFFFVYVGAEAGFGSWITTYVLQKGVTVNTDDAAFIAAYYWAALTAGRALAIVQAIYMTGESWVGLGWGRGCRKHKCVERMKYICTCMFYLTPSLLPPSSLHTQHTTPGITTHTHQLPT